MIMYKKISELNNGVRNDAIIRTFDNAFIPFDPANTDFVEYQKWLELGNTPLPAENE